MVMPSGRAPETMLHANGGRPPVLTTWKLYGVLTVAFGMEVVVMSKSVAIVSGSSVLDKEAGRLESCTAKLMVKVPSSRGVPKSVPSCVSCRPNGRELSVYQLYGVVPPEAVSENG